jgi:5-methylcytosine-specific restriction protein B
MSEDEKKNDIQGQDSIHQDRTKMEFYNPERNEIYDRFDEFVDIVFVQGKQIDWATSCVKKRLTPAENTKFEDLLGKDGKKVYEPLLEKVKKGKSEEEKEKWMSEYPSNQDENGDWAQDKGKNKWAAAIEKDANLRKLLDHLTYIWSLTPVMRTRLYENEKKEKNTAATLEATKDVFPETGLWARGQGSSQKPDDFYTLVLLMESIIKKNSQKEKKISSVKDTIDYIIKYFTEECKDKNPPIKNAFLHLCDAGKYAPIAVKSTKDDIKRNLKFVLSEEEQNELKNQTTDDWVLSIQKKLKEMKISQKTGCVFFEPSVRVFINNKDDGVSDYSILKFKKAVVLYGPPGTSKTYSAMELAKAILLEHYSKEYKKKDTSGGVKKTAQENINNILQNKELGQIHRFQLHSNYSYEDFIWGYAIEDGKTGSVSSPKKGAFLNLLENIKADENKTPHILILDEINRVDLSRLFGELFSAIENRDDNIELPVRFDGAKENYKICIPSNLYIIGTMNEIDFSLERIDFALRRRFAWIFKGYDDGLLEDIIKKKLEDAEVENLNVDNYQDYINECTRLNNKISKDLGKQYQIGHTIFSENVGVLKDICSEDFSLKTIKQAKKILWNISIKPLLEAYLGNVEQEKIDKTISEYEFTYGLKKKRNDKNGKEEVVDEVEEDETPVK